MIQLDKNIKLVDFLEAKGIVITTSENEHYMIYPAWIFKAGDYIYATDKHNLPTDVLHIMNKLNLTVIS